MFHFKAKIHKILFYRVIGYSLINIILKKLKVYLIGYMAPTQPP